MELVLDSCAGRYEQRDRTLILMGIHTGFRIRELLSLHIYDVWHGNAVRKAVTVARGFMKCKIRSRTMPLHARVRQEIESLVKERMDQGTLHSDWPLFNKQQTKKPLSTRQAFDIVVNAAERAGVDTGRVGTHSLRKTFARRMWTSPIVNHDPAKMARLLGHENWNNTLRYLEFADDLEIAVLSV